VTVGFVLCIEAGVLSHYALLLIESIREHAGTYAGAEILAISPRGRGVDLEVQARLRDMHVHYVDEPLNTACPEYGSANRIYAGAWAARNSASEMLVVLDSDTIFLAEPELLGLACDAAVRPVDVKGSTTAGPNDPLEGYWDSLCRLAEFPLDGLPFIATSIDDARVRASYNGGYLVVRRSTGILEWAAEIFTRSVAADLRPLRGTNVNVFASMGLVGPRASEYWGSNQAALAIAIWSRTRRVQTLDRRYNIPLHILARRRALIRPWRAGGPVHVHYHHLFSARNVAVALKALSRLGASSGHISWLKARTPLPF
jgi:hypothetical protein